MEYAQWAAFYDAIRREFGFPFEKEERSAERLVALLPVAWRERPLERALARLVGRDVIVVGLAPGAGAPPLWRLPASAPRPAIVAADGAAAPCLAAGIVPDIIVTDLDGPLPSEVAANGRGALVVIHAHGDNAEAIAEWVPQFPGELAGSWAGPPRPALLNVGGFTDGDRAVFLAHHARARRILLFGFDFDRVEEAEAEAGARKRAKLEWARRLIDELARRGPVPIAELGRDGAERPLGSRYGGPSTQ